MSKRLALLVAGAAFASASLALAAPPDAALGPVLECTAPDADAGQAPEAVPTQLASGPRSTGWPWRGRLPGGVMLPEGQALRHSPHCAVGGRFFGTPELVGMLARAAETVGARLTVGELSTAGGGRVIGHRSHENGRDADVAFYLRAPDGTPVESDDYLDVFRDGHARGDVALFDDARNWLLVRAWLEDPGARVQYVFVENHLRARLLAEAAREGAGAELLARAGHTLMQPPRGDPHRNHFHVRVYCAADDRPACRDKTPFWAWYPALSAETGGLPLSVPPDWESE